MTLKIPDAVLELCTANKVRAQKREEWPFLLCKREGSGKSPKQVTWLWAQLYSHGGICCLIVGWEGSRVRTPMGQGPKAWNNRTSWGLGTAGLGWMHSPGEGPFLNKRLIIKENSSSPWTFAYISLARMWSHEELYIFNWAYHTAKQNQGLLLKKGRVGSG